MSSRHHTSESAAVPTSSNNSNPDSEPTTGTMPDSAPGATDSAESPDLVAWRLSDLQRRLEARPAQRSAHPAQRSAWLAVSTGRADPDRLQLRVALDPGRHGQGEGEEDARRRGHRQDSRPALTNSNRPFFVENNPGHAFSCRYGPTRPLFYHLGG